MDWKFQLALARLQVLSTGVLSLGVALFSFGLGILLAAASVPDLLSAFTPVIILACTLGITGVFFSIFHFMRKTQKIADALGGIPKE